MDLTVPPELVAVADCMPGGHEWIERVPSLARALASRWRVRIVEQLRGGVNSVVAGVELRDGSEAVLKVTLPHPDAEHELDALLAWNGQGAVRVLDVDRASWAALIERCRPGMPLYTEPLGDRAAAEVYADLLPRLHAARPSTTFQPIDVEMRRHATGTRELAERFPDVVGDEDIDRAVATFEGGPRSEPHVVLHRDLHGFNVLASARGWLAIDPKGWGGPAYCDLGMALATGRPTVDQVAWLARSLGFDEGAVIAYAHALAVSLALWNRSVGLDREATIAATTAALLARR